MNALKWHTTAAGAFAPQDTAKRGHTASVGRALPGPFGQFHIWPQWYESGRFMGYTVKVSNQGAFDLSNSGFAHPGALWIDLTNWREGVSCVATLGRAKAICKEFYRQFGVA